MNNRPPIPALFFQPPNYSSSDNAPHTLNPPSFHERQLQQPVKFQPHREAAIAITKGQHHEIIVKKLDQLTSAGLDYVKNIFNETLRLFFEPGSFTYENDTFLILSVRFKQLEVVKFIVEKKHAKLEKRYMNHLCALGVAIESNNVPMVEYLLTRNPPLNRQYVYIKSKTLLTAAIHTQNIALVTKLVNKGAQIADSHIVLAENLKLNAIVEFLRSKLTSSTQQAINISSSQFSPNNEISFVQNPPPANMFFSPLPLGYSPYGGVHYIPHPGVLPAGFPLPADLRVPEKQIKYQPHREAVFAIVHGHSDQIILEKLETLMPARTKYVINVYEDYIGLFFDSINNTPYTKYNLDSLLTLSVRFDRLEVVKFILEIKKANVGARYGSNLCALGVAIESQNIKMVEYLLTLNPPLDRKYRLAEHKTLLTLAIHVENLQLIKMLVEKGAKVTDAHIKFAQKSKQDNIAAYLQSNLTPLEQKEKTINSLSSKKRVLDNPETDAPPAKKPHIENGPKEQTFYLNQHTVSTPTFYSSQMSAENEIESLFSPNYEIDFSYF